MRIESSVTSIGWIPSEAVTGPLKLPFDMGIGRYDPPPPDRIEDATHLERLRAADAFRFANELRAWIEVEDGQIAAYGQGGGLHIGVSRVHLGPAEVAFQAVAMPELRPEPAATKTWVRFVQTAGGRTGAPIPRSVSRPPFVQLTAPLVWTTLALTVHADGSSQYEVVGASPFPRHWIFDHDGRLVQRTALADFKTWSTEIFGRRTPWGEADPPALVTAVESALERELSRSVMGGGAKPRIWEIHRGDTLVRQGDQGEGLYLLLDGVLVVEVDDDTIVEVGPGAILGERALLEEGKRTSTLRAVTACRVAAVPGDRIPGEDLAEIAAGHRREAR